MFQHYSNLDTYKIILDVDWSKMYIDIDFRFGITK
jgi:hypothetical protein